MNYYASWTDYYYPDLRPGGRTNKGYSDPSYASDRSNYPNPYSSYYSASAQNLYKSSNFYGYNNYDSYDNRRRPISRSDSYNNRDYSDRAGGYLYQSSNGVPPPSSSAGSAGNFYNSSSYGYLNNYSSAQEGGYGYGSYLQPSSSSYGWNTSSNTNNYLLGSKADRTFPKVMNTKPYGSFGGLNKFRNYNFGSKKLSKWMTSNNRLGLSSNGTMKRGGNRTFSGADKKSSIGKDGTTMQTEDEEDVEVLPEEIKDPEILKMTERITNLLTYNINLLKALSISMTCTDSTEASNEDGKVAAVVATATETVAKELVGSEAATMMMKAEENSSGNNKVLTSNSTVEPQQIQITPANKSSTTNNNLDNNSYDMALGGELNAAASSSLPAMGDRNYHQHQHQTHIPMKRSLSAGSEMLSGSATKKSRVSKFSNAPNHHNNVPSSSGNAKYTNNNNKSPVLLEPPGTPMNNNTLSRSMTDEGILSSNTRSSSYSSSKQQLPTTPAAASNTARDIYGREHNAMTTPYSKPPHIDHPNKPLDPYQYSEYDTPSSKAFANTTATASATASSYSTSPPSHRSHFTHYTTSSSATSNNNDIHNNNLSPSLLSSQSSQSQSQSQSQSSRYNNPQNSLSSGYRHLNPPPPPSSSSSLSYYGPSGSAAGVGATGAMLLEKEWNSPYGPQSAAELHRSRTYPSSAAGNSYGSHYYDHASMIAGSSSSAAAGLSRGGGESYYEYNSNGGAGGIGVGMGGGDDYYHRGIIGSNGSNYPAPSSSSSSYHHPHPRSSAAVILNDYPPAAYGNPPVASHHRDYYGSGGMGGSNTTRSDYYRASSLSSAASPYGPAAINDSGSGSGYYGPNNPAIDWPYPAAAAAHNGGNGMYEDKYNHHRYYDRAPPGSSPYSKKPPPPPPHGGGGSGPAGGGFFRSPRL